MRKVYVLLVALSLVAVVQTTRQAAAQSMDVLRFHGSNTVGEKLAPALVQAYLRQRDPDAIIPSEWTPGDIENEKYIDIDSTQPGMPDRVWVRAHGSGTSFEALREGNAEIGMSSRKIKAKELVQLAAFGAMTSPEAEHVIALDGLAVIVHPNNPVHSLTIDQIHQMFRCEITDWSEVGGVPGPVTIYARDNKSGTFDTFKSMVLRKKPLCASAKRFESNSQLSDEVSRDPSAIGFTGIAYIRDSKPLAIKECALSYEPTVFAVKTEEYPLARRLYLYTPPQNLTPIVEDFLQYVQTEEAQKVVASQEFVDLNIESSSKPEAARMLMNHTRGAIAKVQSIDTLQDYVAFTDGAERLSVTFRFPVGGIVLDGRAETDIRRLAAYMKKRPERELLLLGFADSTGAYGANKSLSRRRARVIADRLAELGVPMGNDQVVGIGEEVPVACDNEAGYAKNRRVEAWIR